MHQLFDAPLLRHGPFPQVEAQDILEKRPQKTHSDNPVFRDLSRGGQQKTGTQGTVAEVVGAVKLVGDLPHSHTAESLNANE
jgi:hypothetical protein